MDFRNCALQALTEKTVDVICQWEYDVPYNVYDFKGRPNKYLLKKDTWGKEQFCLMNDNEVVGQVACQFDNNDLWVGWSLAPKYCGKGLGHLFVLKCIEDIRKIKDYKGKIFLRVAAVNERAIKAYQRAGFVYDETIQDEVAYTNHVEDFWVMVNRQ